MALRPGDHCVFPIDMYHGLKTWLKAYSAHWGMRIDHVDMTNQEKVHAAVIPGMTRLVWLETPSNPHWHIYDITHLAEIAHRAGAKLVVDSTSRHRYSLSRSSSVRTLSFTRLPST